MKESSTAVFMLIPRVYQVVGKLTARVNGLIQSVHYFGGKKVGTESIVF